jgi:GNAT superfamily N-acetyltransferase
MGPVEFAALTDFQRAAPAALAAEQRIEVLELAGAVCSVVGSEPTLTLVNRVVGLGLYEPADDRIIDAVEAFFSRPRARFMVIGDVAGLEGRGYSLGDAWAIFERGAEPYAPPPSQVDILEIGADRAQEFGAVCGAGSETPTFLSKWFAALAGRNRWHCFVALDGEATVATGALYAEGNAGYLGFAATLPEYRGRGAQNALLAARIERAQELGLTTLAASAAVRPGGPSGSYRNIERAGFRLVRVRANWLSSA